KSIYYMTSQYCRNCGKTVTPGAYACINCGLPPMKGKNYCFSCGAASHPDAVICIKCGVNLEQPQSQQPQQTQQPQYQRPAEQYRPQEVFQNRPPKSWLAESILVTLFCCMPFGIAGIVNASRVESRFYA